MFRLQNSISHTISSKVLPSTYSVKYTDKCSMRCKNTGLPISHVLVRGELYTELSWVLYGFKHEREREREKELHKEPPRNRVCRSTESVLRSRRESSWNSLLTSDLSSCPMHCLRALDLWTKTQWHANMYEANWIRENVQRRRSRTRED